MFSLSNTVARLYQNISGGDPSLISDPQDEHRDKVEEIDNNIPESNEKEAEATEEKKPESEIGSFPILIPPKSLPPIQSKPIPSPPPSYSSIEPPIYQEIIIIHPFAPTPTEASQPTTPGLSEDQSIPKVQEEAEDNQSAPFVQRDSVDPNWFPGLPRPPPGVYVEPPRNRSKCERLRYLADFQRLYCNFNK